MDSEQSQTHSFLNLLNSQLPNNEYPTQFLSFSPTPEVGGADSRAQSGEDRRQRNKWSTAEDLVLISAWLNTSKDPIVGNEQRAGTFWKRIHSYYNASPKVVGLTKRELNHCKQRWGKINEGVSKFVGSYEAATKHRTSGQNEDDVLKAAHEIFLNDYKLKFTLEHAWRELRNDQKWCGTYGSSQQSSGSKRKRVGEEQSMPSVNEEGEASARPIGVKAAKAKAKRSVGEGSKKLEDFQQMWELKLKDTEAKRELSHVKMELSQAKLLEKLLEKTEPLTELEVELKNKLIRDQLSM